MKNLTKTLMIIVAGAFLISISVYSCQSKTAEATEDAAVSVSSELSKEEMIKRGEYLVSIAGCHDCHTPKIMTDKGQEFDMSRALSGHPEGSEVPEIDLSLMGKWVLFAMDLTAAVGPWGVTFSANLTPDDQTGTGGWTSENFVNAMRTGKHMGIADGRPIMPPMPWFVVANMTDEDLNSVFAYLRSLPPIKNKVPDPILMENIASSDKVKLAPKKS